MTFNDKKTTGMVFGEGNVNCKASQGNGNIVDWVTNAEHLGNVVDDKLSDLKDINAIFFIFYCECKLAFNSFYTRHVVLSTTNTLSFINGKVMCV